MGAKPVSYAMEAVGYLANSLQCNLNLRSYGYLEEGLGGTFGRLRGFKLFTNKIPPDCLYLSDIGTEFRQQL